MLILRLSSFYFISSSLLEATSGSSWGVSCMIVRIRSACYSSPVQEAAKFCEPIFRIFRMSGERPRTPESLRYRCCTRPNGLLDVAGVNLFAPHASLPPQD